MKLRFSLIPLEPSVPGKARLCVSAYDGEHLGVQNYQIQLERKDVDAYLQADGRWGAQSCWLQLQGWTEFEGGVAVLIDASVLDPILLQETGLRIALRNEQGSVVGVRGLSFNPLGLALSSAAGTGAQQAEAVHVLAPVSQHQPEPQPEPQLQPVPAPEPETVVEPIVAPVEEPEIPVIVEPPASPPVQQAPTKTRSRWGLWVGLAILAAAAAGGVAYWLSQDKPVEPLADVPKEPAGVCSLERMQTMAELTFVQECVNENYDSAQWLEVIGRAKQAGKCEIAQRLYVNKAQAGDAAIALAYAREYDPAQARSTQCFTQANPATAAYWYETVLMAQPENADAKARLQELSQ